MIKQLDETSCLQLWLRQKSSRRRFHRLSESTAVEHEYRKHSGHPSSYAFVHFDCVPADSLVLESAATWPADLDAGAVAALESGIAEAIVDVLFASYYPYRGCSIRLARVTFDPVGSSEVAFHRAATEAMKKLVATARWDLQRRS